MSCLASFSRRLATTSGPKRHLWRQATLAAFLAVCVCLSSPVVLGQENTFPQVKQKFDQKAYGLARQGFLTLAEQGDRRAMFYLGVIYNQGLGTAADQQQSFVWYEKAAKLGHAVAQYNLGNAFKHGRGTTKSEELAAFWWQKAAEQGQTNAQYNLALQYYLGQGVNKDVNKAVFYLQEAANGGHPKAKAMVAEGKIPARPPQAQPQKPRQPLAAATQPSAPASTQIRPAPQSAPATPPPPPARLNGGSVQPVVAKDGAATPSQAKIQQWAADTKPLAATGGTPATPLPPGPAERSTPLQPKTGNGAAVAAKTGASAVLDATWLRAQDPGRFTIQLAVMTNKAYLESFLDTYGLEGEAKVLEVSVANQKRYHVLLGDFPGEDSAQAKINGLAAKLQALKPWPRSYKALLGVAEIR